MDPAFETILLQGNFNPVVKLEPLTINDDSQNEDSSYADYSIATQESKIGEIFYVAKDRIKFVCVHCFAEFPLLVQFTVHVQQHLREIYAVSIGGTAGLSVCEAIDIQPSPLDLVAGSSARIEEQHQQDDDDWVPPKKRGKTKNMNINCTDCNRCFSHPVCLRRHREAFHEGKMYECPICNIRIAYKGNMLRHFKKQHPNERSCSPLEVCHKARKTEQNETGLVECYECNKTFTDAAALNHHWTEEHEGPMKAIYDKPKKIAKPPRNKWGLYECVDCSDSFRLFCMLTRHRDAMHNGRRFRCQICSATITYKKNTLRHMRSMHPEQSENSFVEVFENENDDPFDAQSNSTKAFKSVRRRKRRQFICSLEKKYKCSVCDAGFAFRKSFCSHMAKKHPETDLEAASVKAEISEAINDAGQTIEQQITKTGKKKAKIIDRTHHRYYKSTCEPCQLEFTNKWSLVWHLRNAHNSNGAAIQSFVCYLCHTNSNSLKKLKLHFRKKHCGRTKHVPRPCDTCGQEFPDEYSFTKHRRWHKEQLIGRPHKCEVCGSAFVERFEWVRHMQKHATTRNFKCEICGNAFRSIRAKYSHMRTHTDKGKVQCDECGLFLRGAFKLKTHRLTHTGETPYECEFCHKRFRQSYNLAVHRRIHTREYIHYCKPCERGFGARNELRKHNLRIHGIELVPDND